MAWHFDWSELVIAAVFAVYFGFTYLPRRREQSVQRRVEAWGLASSEPAPAAIGRGIIALTRGAIAGSALVVGGAFTFVGIGDTSNPTSLWLLFGFGAVGWFLGVLITAFEIQLRSGRTSVEPSREQIVRLSDYVPGRLRFLIWAITSVAVLLMAFVVYLGASFPVHQYAWSGDIREYLRTSAWLTGAGLITLALFEVAGRGLIRRASSASNPGELVWRDALRGQTLNTMLLAQTFGVLYALVQTIFIVSFTGAPDWIRLLVQILAASAAIALGVPAFVGASTAPRRYLHRLWPELAARLLAAQHERWVAASLELQSEVAGREAGGTASS